MKFLKKNYIYFLLGTVFIFIIVSFLFSQFNQTQKPIPSATPDPRIPAQGKDYQESVEKIRVSEAEHIRRDALVTKLLEKLPYLGSNFTLDYSYNSLQFIFTIKKGSETAGTKEFEQFLLQNQITDKTWLGSLIIK